MAHSKAVAHDCFACCICGDEYEDHGATPDGCMLTAGDTPRGAFVICADCTKQAVAGFAEQQREALEMARACRHY